MMQWLSNPNNDDQSAMCACVDLCMHTSTMVQDLKTLKKMLGCHAKSMQTR